MLSAEDRQAFLVLEYIELSGRRNPALLGSQLAQMHRRTSERYGWSRDNTIGSTPQINTPSTNWIEFWRAHRFGIPAQARGEKWLRRQIARQGRALDERSGKVFSPSRDENAVRTGSLSSNARPRIQLDFDRKISPSARNALRPFFLPPVE
ncbi:MAG: fructosamine kinase family protein [Burkholderiales bacterium]